MAHTGKKPKKGEPGYRPRKGHPLPAKKGSKKGKK